MTFAIGVALSLGGCGKKAATPAEAQLEREDLVAVARALRSVETPVARATAAAKAAWPLLLDGVPAAPSAAQAAGIEAAVRSASAVPLPALFGEQESASLTGPASSLAGRYRDYEQLSSASWKQIGAALAAARGGSRSASAFARANAPLYIEGIYDAQYSLGETSKSLLDAYKTLGGTKTLGAALSEAEVLQLARTYTRAQERLQARARVRLGS